MAAIVVVLYAMLMRPKKAKTAVNGCYLPDDMAVPSRRFVFTGMPFEKIVHRQPTPNMMERYPNIGGVVLQGFELRNNVVGNKVNLTIRNITFQRLHVVIIKCAYGRKHSNNPVLVYIPYLFDLAPRALI